MKEKDILREVMLLCGVSQTELSKKCGYKHQSRVGNILMQKSLGVDIMAKLLDAMGYDLIVRGREEVQAPGGNRYTPEWTVDVGGKEDDQ